MEEKMKIQDKIFDFSINLVKIHFKHSCFVFFSIKCPLSLSLSLSLSLLKSKYINKMRYPTGYGELSCCPTSFLTRSLLLSRLNSLWRVDTCCSELAFKVHGSLSFLAACSLLSRHGLALAC